MRCKSLVTLVLLALLITLTPFGVQNSQASSGNGPVLRMTLLVPPPSLNYNTITTSGSAWNIVMNEYLGLDGGIRTPSGGVARYHSVTDWTHHNDNFTVWEFNVAGGLKWSDGSPVTSADILATDGPQWAFNSTYADFLGFGPELKSEYALNSTTAVFVLNTSDPLWALKMGGDSDYSVIYPASVINQHGILADLLGTNKCDGPFCVTNYQSGQTTMIMTRNPYFQPQPKISEIDINFVETLPLTTTYLVSGSTDLAPVEWGNVGAVLRNPNFKVLDQKGFDYTTLEFNSSIFPYNNFNFRQALVYGVNQSQVVGDAFDGYGLTAYSAEGGVSPSVSTWYSAKQQQYNFDPAKAVSLLAAMGITKGSDGLLHYQNGTAVSLTIWADTDNTADITAASVMQSDLQELGFQVTLQTTSEANIIGYYDTNVQNIRNNIILYTASTAVEPGDPIWYTVPGWAYYYAPVVPNISWESSASADAAFNGNSTAFSAATTTAGEFSALANIQSINAQHLPTVILCYPDNVWAYNAAQWTGLPRTAFDYGGGPLNNTALIFATPATATSTSVSSVTTSATQATTTLTQAPVTTTSTTTSVSVSTLTATSTITTGAAQSSMSSLSYLLGAIAIVVIVAAVVVALRRGGRAAAK